MLAIAYAAQLHFVASTLYKEAATQSEYGIRCVASTMYYRSHGDPKKVYRVCRKRKAYSCWNEINMDNYTAPPHDWKWKLCTAIAHELLSGKFDPVINATHYHASWMKMPDCFCGLHSVCTVGKHTFYR